MKASVFVYKNVGRKNRKGVKTIKINMNDKLKKLVATGTALAALLLSSGVALASAEAEASVEDDGTAYSYSEDNDDFRVRNRNSGGLFNLDAGVGVSGFNSQSGNDDDNSLGTGDAEGEAESDNFGNSNITLIEDDEEAGSSTSDASVGEDGTATSYAYDNDIVEVINCNHADLDNLTLGLAISGLNDQSGNDDGNDMDTGDSDAIAATLNEVNSNWTMIGGSHSAHATAEVGDDGAAYAFAEDNDEITVRNRNSADLGNLSLAIAVSGGNTQSGNDDDNSMETGGSTAESSANNFVNSNITVVGGGDGGSSTADASVGEDGTATSYAYDDDTVGVTNNNEAEVTNVSAGVAVSGGNEQSGNDDGNSMTTGSSSGSSCSTNTFNSNWTAIGSDVPEGGDSGCE